MSIMQKLRFVRYESIGHRIIRAREKERIIVQKAADEKFKRFEKTSEENHKLDLEEKDAEIASMQAQMDQLIKALHDTETTFNTAINMERKARRVSTEVKFQIDHFMHEFQKSYQAIHAISDRAIQHEEETRKEVEHHRKLLRGDSSK